MIRRTFEATWRVKLKPGRYTYQYDPHASGAMNGHFTLKR
jgi:plastocyanin